MKKVLMFFLFSVILFAENDNLSLKKVKEIEKSGKYEVQILEKNKADEMLKELKKKKEKSLKEEKVIKNQPAQNIEIKSTIIQAEKKIYKEKTLKETVEFGINHFSKINLKDLKDEIIRLASKNKDLDIEFIKQMKIDKSNLTELLEAVKDIGND